MPQEQVAYQVSGHGQARLFELYLFVNPLGQDCRRVERELSRAIKQMPAKDGCAYSLLHQSTPHCPLHDAAGL